MGKYEERFVDTDTPKVLGQYENGMKTGCWLEFNDLGDTLSVENYANDLLDGEKVVFAGGVREEIQHYKAGKTDFLFYWIILPVSQNAKRIIRTDGKMVRSVFG